MEIVLCVLLVTLFALFLACGGREMIGETLMKLFPKKDLGDSKGVHIYLDGEYNRTASISSVSGDILRIYGNVPLPINYRGRFYATGIDRNDGSKLVYVACHKHYKFVRVAELIRIVFSVCNDEEQLPDDEHKDSETEIEEKEVEDEV